MGEARRMIRNFKIQRKKRAEDSKTMRLRTLAECRKVAQLLKLRRVHLLARGSDLTADDSALLRQAEQRIAEIEAWMTSRLRPDRQTIRAASRAIDQAGR